MSINYIPDEEINLENDNLLGAEPYVNTLSEIITKSKTPFTIGLFGGWGVGKSSIIKTIKDKYNNDLNSDIAVFTYDAWKYSNDSFRRTFLFELKEFFKLEGTDSFKSFYEDRSEDIDHRIALKKYSFWWWLTLSPLLLILIWALPAEMDLKITTSVISVFLTIISTLLRETFVQYKVTVSKQKIFAPEQFEKVFNEIIEVVTNKPREKFEWIKKIFGKQKKKTKKLVIAIDNIDRCHKDLAFELLLTIKNFLDKRGVVFIIPIDEVEVKKHISKQGNDANEFLRKLFNTSLSIKTISEGDLFAFAKRLNDDYKLGLQVDVISIVAQQFSKNPRKIIQFLNVLQTEILLSKNQENRNLIPKGALTENIPFITKILIIREEWPKLYQKIKESTYSFANIYEEVKPKEGKFFIDDCEINLDQRNYLRRTNHIIPNHDNYELFFINQDSFKNIPDKTNILVESNDLESIKEQLNNKEIKFDELIEFIDSKFETALERGEIKTSIVNILSLIFGLAVDEDLNEQAKKCLSNSSKFLGGFRNFIATDKIKDILADIDNSILLKFIKEYELISGNILQVLVLLMSSRDDYKQTIIDYVNIFNDDPQKLKKVSSKFSEYLSKDMDFASKAKPFLSNETVIESLVEPKLIDAYIEKIDNNIESSDTNQRYELIYRYNEIFALSDKQIQDLSTKLVSYINSVNDFSKMPFWFDKLNMLIDNIEDASLITNIFSMLSNKQNWLFQQYSQLWNSEDFKNTLKTYFVTITKLYIVASDQNQQNQLFAWLNQFFTRDESQEIIIFINDLLYDIVDEHETYKWPFSKTVINRFTTVNQWETKKEIAKTLNLMLVRSTIDEGLTEQQIQTILTNYVNLINDENHDEILSWISELLKNEVLVSHFDNVIDKQNEARKFELLKFLNELNKVEIIEKIISSILQNTECGGIDDIIQSIENIGVNRDVVIKSYKAVLRSVDSERENYKCLIEALSNSEYTDDVIHNLIAEKVKNLLATREKDEILFALRVIENLDIKDSRKLQGVKTLIQDINENVFESDELKFIKKMKKKHE